jgi:hypothetical protein
MYLSEKNAQSGVLAIRSFILSGKLTKFPQALCIVISYISGSKQIFCLFAAKLTQFVIFLIKTSFICEALIYLLDLTIYCQ